MSRTTIHRTITSSGIVLCIALLAGTAPAAADQPRLEWLSHRGGNLPGGAVEGVPMNRFYDASGKRADLCAGNPPAAGNRPIATPAGSLALVFGLWDCEEKFEVEAPQLECSWSVAPNRSQDPSCRCNDQASASGCANIRPAQGTFTATGWEGNVTLDVPGAIGRYELALSCKVDGVDAPEIRQPLYLNRATPMQWVSPPPVDWYERGVCAAEGLASGTSEVEVLEVLVDGLYRYGQRNWRYGYAKRLSDAGGSYEFPAAGGNETYSVPPAELICYGESYCKCHWQGLASGTSRCNFADCYNFSKTLHAISATMGVGGLVPVVERGERNSGYLTPPSARSVDPKFTGNVVCSGAPTCYSYLFGNHSLRGRDGKIYDSTFGLIYDDVRQGIGTDIVSFQGRDRVLADANAFAARAESQYGGWAFYDLTAARQQSPAEGGGARLTGNATFRRQPASAGGFSWWLEAKVEVEILQQGTYYMGAALGQRGAPGTPAVPFVYRQSFETSDAAGGAAAGAPGLHNVRVRFSGEEIYRSGVDGQYVVMASLGDQLIEIDTTESYRHTDFGEWPANFDLTAPPSGIDVDRNGKFNYLEVPIGFNVRLEGDYAVELRLHKGSETAAYSGSLFLYREGTDFFEVVNGYSRFRPGQHTIRAGFYGKDVKSGGDGTYRVTAIVFDSQRVALGGEQTEEFQVRAAQYD